MIIISQNKETAINSNNMPSVSYYDTGFQTDEGYYLQFFVIVAGDKILGYYSNEDDCRRAMADLVNALSLEEQTGQQSYQVE